jgi:large subunit ribosomal protein L24
MHIKKDDNVIVIAGKDKGKTGKVARAYPKLSTILIEGVNIKKRHTKSRKQGKKGSIIEKSAPIHVSNVLIVDPKTNKGSRVGKKLVGDKYVRVAQKSGAELK